MSIILVTGNPNKLRELQAMAPDDMDINTQAIDLPEIQSLNPQEIIRDKAERAYDVVGGPVIVEDVSVGLDDFGGLPGPFYKFFRETLSDAVLLRLVKIASERITIRCDAAYYDGKFLLLGKGVVHGVVVEKRGERGFGFDPYVIPDGHSLTMAEMSSEEKNKISHRGQAFRDLLAQIRHERAQ